MAKWIGTRDYNEFVGFFRKDSTEKLLEHVKCDIYCITTIFANKELEERFDWIVIWNSYITLKANLDVLAERCIDIYPTKLAAEAMLARLKNAIDKRRAEGRESRVASKPLHGRQRLA